MITFKSKTSSTKIETPVVTQEHVGISNEGLVETAKFVFVVAASATAGKLASEAVFVGAATAAQCTISGVASVGSALFSKAKGAFKKGQESVKAKKAEMEFAQVQVGK